MPPKGAPRPTALELSPCSGATWPPCPIPNQPFLNSQLAGVPFPDSRCQIIVERDLSEIGRSAGLDHKTAEHYLRVLEQLYLVERVQPWFRNELSRLVKTPKLHFIDSGLLAAMRGYSVARMR